MFLESEKKCLTLPPPPSLSDTLYSGQIWHNLDLQDVKRESSPNFGVAPHYTGIILISKINKDRVSKMISP